MKEFIKKYFQRATTSGKFIQEIDGLRFFAIAPVVVHHLAERIMRQMKIENMSSEMDDFYYSLIPSGPLGVELFFVISGFVISMPLLKTWLASNSISSFSYWKYFKRRLTRLEPPYLIVMLVSFAALLLLTNSGTALITGTRSFAREAIPLNQSLLASFFYLHGLVFLSYPRINPPAWSLEIEFQFYIVAPLILMLLFLVLKIIKSKKMFSPFLLVLLLALKILFYSFVPPPFQKFLVIEYIEFFFLGFFLCYLFLNNYFEKNRSNLQTNFVFILGILILLITDYFLKTERILILEISKFFGLFLFFFAVFSGGIGRILARSVWVSAIGGMCYSIYLLHLMILQVGVSFLFSEGYFGGSFLGNLLIYSLMFLPVILIVSAIFYLLLEKPCMNPNWPSKLKVFVFRNQK